MAVAELRQKRVENDIETLRSTQSGLMDRIDDFTETLNETRDIALDNQSRLDRIELRLDAIDYRLDRVEQITAENRVILVTIAEHLGLTYEVPPRRPQAD